MAATPERSSTRSDPRLPRMYSPELQPLLQSLLATVADIDFAYESDINTIRNSSAEEWVKQTLIHKLHLRHRKRRQPYVRQLAVLQERITAMAA